MGSNSGSGSTSATGSYSGSGSTSATGSYTGSGSNLGHGLVFRLGLNLGHGLVNRLGLDLDLGRDLVGQLVFRLGLDFGQRLDSIAIEPAGGDRVDLLVADVDRLGSLKHHLGFGFNRRGGLTLGLEGEHRLGLDGLRLLDHRFHGRGELGCRPGLGRHPGVFSRPRVEGRRDDRSGWDGIGRGEDIHDRDRIGRRPRTDHRGAGPTLRLVLVPAVPTGVLPTIQAEAERRVECVELDGV